MFQAGSVGFGQQAVVAGATMPLFGASGPSFGANAQGLSQPTLLASSQNSFGGGFGQSHTSHITAGSSTKPPGAPFGASSFAAQPTLFGAPASAPSNQQSLFGGATMPQPSLFGSSTSSIGQSSIFGASSQVQQPSSFMGGAAASQPFSMDNSSFVGANIGAPGSQQQYFGQGYQQQQSFQSQQQQQQCQQALDQRGQVQLQTLGVILPTKLNELVQSIGPHNPDSPFRTTLYNVVSPSDVVRYQRPHEMPEKDFDAAMLNNPDPSRLVPVLAMGFDDLHRRTELQEARVGEHAAALVAIESIIARIEDSVTTDLDTKLAIYRRSHRELARKLLNLACRVERKACANDADPSLTRTEIEHKRCLDAAARNLAAPGLFKDKLSDLIELAEATKSERSRISTVTAYSQNATATHAIRDLLQEQLVGISHLGEVCRRADRDLTILESELGS